MPASPPSELVVFGAFEFDPRTLELRRAGARLNLPPQPARLLALLVERPGELVTREEIRHALWDDDVVVDFAHGVNACVRQLRSALGDRAGKARFVETLPKRGYRFLAPVERRRSVAGNEGAVESPGATHVAGVPEITDATAASPRTARGSHWSVRAWPLIALALAGLAWLAVTTLPERTRADANAPTPPDGRIRIAVLPFDDLTRDAERAYFAAGLTEEMIFHLSRLHPERLGAIARTSVLGFTGTRESARSIGAELGVDYLVEGSVRLGSDRVRVRATLVETDTHTPVWSDTIERELVDVLAIQSQVATGIAESLAVELLQPAAARSGRRATDDPLAYDAFLRARHEWNRFDGPGLERSIELYREAVERDPGYGAAWAAMAEAYDLLPFNGVLAAEEAYPLAIEAAERALAIDDSLGAAWNALGFARLYYEWDWESSEAAFRRAVELEPGYAMAHHWFAGLLSATARHDETIQELELAIDLDPLSLSVRSDLAWYYLFADRYAEGVTEAKVALARDPEHGWSLAALVIGEARRGDFEAARAGLVTLVAKNGASPGDLQAVRTLPAREALEWVWRQNLPRVEGEITSFAGDAYYGAAQFALVGEADQAFALLERAFAERHGWLVFLGVDPRFDLLHGDARWADLSARIGLTR